MDATSSKKCALDAGRANEIGNFEINKRRTRPKMSARTTTSKRSAHVVKHSDSADPFSTA